VKSIPATEVVTVFVTRGPDLLGAGDVGLLRIRPEEMAPLKTVPGLREAWQNVAGGT